MEVGWQLLSEAAQFMAEGDTDSGDRVIKCAFGVLPDTTYAKQSGCAPMKVMWTRDVLYPLGRLEEALATIEEAVVCDSENPEAQLIREQLQAIVAQQQAEAEAAAAAGQPGEGGMGGEQPPAQDPGAAGADELFE